MNFPRKPDWRVSTPSQIDPSRWVDIGAAWNGATDEGHPYVSVQLDVMPPIGKLTLFPRVDKAKKAEKTKKPPLPATGTEDKP